MARAGFVDDTEPRTALGRLRSWWRRDSPVDPREWGGAALLVLTIAALSRQPPLAILAFVIALVGMGARLLWDVGLRGVRYTREFSAHRAEIGDVVTLTQRVENDTPLPLGRLDVAEGTTWQAVDLGARTAKGELATVFTASPYQRVEQTHELACRYRGWARLGPTKLAAHDPLGIASREELRHSYEGVLVWPRTVPVTGLPLAQLLADEIPRLPANATVVLVTGEVDGRVQRALLRAVRDGGRRFVIVSTGGPVTLLPALRGRVVARRVTGEEGWDVISRIDLR